MEGTSYLEAALYDKRVTAMDSMRTAAETTPVVLAKSNSVSSHRSPSIPHLFLQRLKHFRPV